MDYAEKTIKSLITDDHIPDAAIHPENNAVENWCGSYMAFPNQVLYPANEAELAHALKDEKQKKEQVRVVGAGHSFNLGFASQDTIVDLKNMNRVLRFSIFDLPTPSINEEMTQKLAAFMPGANKKYARALIEGGARVRDLLDYAKQKGFTLPFTGSIHGQTCSGIIANDVHSTSSASKPGCMSEFVTRIWVMDFKGQVQELKRGDTGFKAAVGGAGCTGIITKIEWLLVPIFYYRRNIYHIKLEEFDQKALDRLLNQNEHVRIFWFPSLKILRVMTWNIVQRDEENGSDKKEGKEGKEGKATKEEEQKEKEKPLWEEKIRSLTDSVEASLLTEPAFKHEWVSKFEQWLQLGQKEEDVFMASEAFIDQTAPVHDELEVSVNYRDTMFLFQALQKTSIMKDPMVTLFELRFVRTHAYSLVGHAAFFPSSSSNQNQNEMQVHDNAHATYRTYFDLIRIVGSEKGANKFPESKRPERDVVELLQHFNALPHMGKNISWWDADQWMSIGFADKLAQFKEICRQNDPQQKFQNDFTRFMFGS